MSVLPNAPGPEGARPNGPKTAGPGPARPGQSARPHTVIGPHGSAAPDRPPASVVIGRRQEAVFVTVRGELGPFDAQQLDRMLADLIDGQGNKSLTVDLRDATPSDDEGLTALVIASAAQRAQRRGAVLAISHPPEPIQKALRAYGLTIAGHPDGTGRDEPLGPPHP